MKTILFVATLAVSTMAFANPTVNSCETKRAEITKELEHAKAHKNIAKIAGLEKALAENTANCTAEGLAKDHQEKLTKLQSKVDERMEELKKAEASGKAKKIEKAKKKLKEAEEEFQAAKK